MTLSTRRYWALLILLCTVGLLLRLYRLEQKGVWFDELATILPAAKPSIHELLATTEALEKNPPLHHLILFYWSKVSSSLGWLRFSSVLFGVGTIAATAALGRLVGGKRVGLLAALLAAFNPFLIHHAQQVRMYAAFGLGSAVATLLLLRAMQSPSKKKLWIAYSLVSALTLWMHYLFGLLYAAHALCVASKPSVRKRWLRWQGLTVLLFGTLVPYFLRNIANLSEGTATKALRGWDLPNLFRHLAVEFPTPHQPAVLTIVFVAAACLFFAGVFLMGLWAACRRHGKELLILMLVPPAVVFIVSLVQPIYNPRYFIMIAPVFCVLAALGLDSVRAVRLRAALVASGVALCSISLAYYFYDIDYRRADYTQMNATLQRSGAKVVYHFDYETFLADYWLSDLCRNRESLLIDAGHIPYWKGRPIIPTERQRADRPANPKEFWLVVRKPIHHWERLESVDARIRAKLGEPVLRQVAERVELNGLAVIHVKPTR